MHRESHHDFLGALGALGGWLFSILCLRFGSYCAGVDSCWYRSALRFSAEKHGGGCENFAGAGMDVFSSQKELALSLRC